MIDKLSQRLVPDALWALAEPLIRPAQLRPQGGVPGRICPSFGVTVPTAHRRFTELTRAGEWRRLRQAVLDETTSD